MATKASPKPPAMIDPDTATVQAFSAEFHRVLADLHSQNESINAKMSEINNAATGPLTAAENLQLDALSVSRKKVDQAISLFTMIHNMAINSSGSIKNLKALADDATAALGTALKHLNDVVKTIDDVNAVIATLTSFVTALGALAAL
jgi:hypothetical protein